MTLNAGQAAVLFIITFMITTTVLDTLEAIEENNSCEIKEQTQ
jgi:hypothetical protein